VPTTTSSHDPSSPEPSAPERIAASWHRSRLAGVDPVRAHGSLSPVDIDPHGSLYVAADPVLNELAENLDGTTYATLLVDRDCRIVHRWCGRAQVARAFDGLGVDLGASLLEERLGTNAPGTALETRLPVLVHGPEHFAEMLRDFSCFAMPIRHPVTHRIEGVLDITSLASDANPLLRPVVQRAVTDIQRRLQDGSRTTDKQLLLAFHEAVVACRGALVAVGENLTVANQTAQDTLTGADIAVLRILLQDVHLPGATVMDMNLESGESVHVHAEVLDTRRLAALVRIEPREPRRGLSVSALTEEAREPGTILVAGPPGSGRTSLARELAPSSPITLLTGATTVLEGDGNWAKQFRRRMAAGVGTVIIDGLELLSDALLGVVADALESRTRAHVVMVSAPLAELSEHTAAVAALASRVEEKLPLAARRDEIPGLARELLSGINPDAFLTPGAERLLVEHRWPGNVRELRAVLAHAAARRRFGAIVAADLPPKLGSVPGPRAAVRPLDQAERDVILHELIKHDGNKAAVARELGISRTTLYAKMRALRISTY